MQKFTIALFTIIFIPLAIGSVQSASADHVLFSGKGIFIDDENNVNLELVEDSKYQLHIQVTVRSPEGHLISVTEGTYGYYIPHEMSDYFFDEMITCSNSNVTCKKENVIIDKMTYEKWERKSVQTVNIAPTASRSWVLNFCAEFIEHGELCVPAFQVFLPYISLATDDLVTIKWIILRTMN